MTRTFGIHLWCLLALVLPGAAAEASVPDAAPVGLGAIHITPASVPADPQPALDLLNALPGFAGAQWDSGGGRFTVLAGDSAHFEPRELVDALREAGVEVSRLTMHFEEVHAKYENDAGILYSPPNRLAFPAVFTWTGQRFWGFWGKNPRGKNAAFRMDLDVRLGEVRPDGTAAADSVEIVRFELTKPYFKGE